MLTACRLGPFISHRITRGCRRHQRWLHSANELPQTKGVPEAYVSLSSDPWFNLSLEHFLFTTRDSETPVCFLYRNRPCVVVGRNQNPWKEINSRALHDQGISLVRRRSGGGTVYHDLGNTNYSFHVPRAAFARHIHADLVVRALNSPAVGLGQEPGGGAYVNARNDICVRVPAPSSDGEGSAAASAERKVSGSAYKLVSARAYHHGTMLLSASLSSLGDALHNVRGDSLVTKGVASVRASVTNLAEAFPRLARRGTLTHDVFVRAVVDEFASTYADAAGADFGAAGETSQLHTRTIQAHTLDEHLLSSTTALQQGYDELRSWDWTHGQTPEFTHTLPALPFEWTSALARHSAQAIVIHSRHGLVTDVQLSAAREDERASPSPTDEALLRVLERLKGAHYDKLAFAPPDGEGIREGAAREQPSSGARQDSLERTVEHDLLQWFKHVL